VPIVIGCRERILIYAFESLVRTNLDLVYYVSVVEVDSGQVEVFLDEHVLLLLTSS
jgi:hypothetical protein